MLVLAHLAARRGRSWSVLASKGCWQVSEEPCEVSRGSRLREHNQVVAHIDNMQLNTSVVAICDMGSEDDGVSQSVGAGCL